MDSTEFVSIIEAAMLKSATTDPENQIFSGLMAAVTAYADHWLESHDDDTLYAMESDLEGDPTQPPSLAHVAGLRPSDAFVLQVLDENLDGNEWYNPFRAWLGRPTH